MSSYRSVGIEPGDVEVSNHKILGGSYVSIGDPSKSEVNIANKSELKSKLDSFNTLLNKVKSYGKVVKPELIEAFKYGNSKFNEVDTMITSTIDDVKSKTDNLVNQCKQIPDKLNLWNCYTSHIDLHHYGISPGSTLLITVKVDRDHYVETIFFDSKDIYYRSYNIEGTIRDGLLSIRPTYENYTFSYIKSAYVINDKTVNYASI